MVAECTDVEGSRLLMQSRGVGGRSALPETQHLKVELPRPPFSLRLPGAPWETVLVPLTRHQVGWRYPQEVWRYLQQTV